MHTGGGKPDKEGFASFVSSCDEVFGGFQELFIHGFHAFTGQRTGVFELAVRSRPDDTAWRDLFEQFRIGRVVG